MDVTTSEDGGAPVTRTAPTPAASDADDDLDLEVAAWLVTAAGRDAVDDATTVVDELGSADPVRLATAVRRRVADANHAAAVLQVATARQRLAARGVDVTGLLVTRVAAEMASDPLVAAWRAQRYLDAGVWDLCAGIGGDALALGRVATSLTCVERSPARALLLRHNLGVRGIDAEVVVGDALHVAPPADAWIHADPGRRVGERRVRSLGSTQPPVDALLAAHRDTPAIGVVVGPGVDLQDPALPQDAEVEFVQRGDQLVEAVLWLGALRSGEGHARATATLLPGEASGGSPDVVVGPTPVATRTRVTAAVALPVGAIGDHLVEVVPAAVRARLHDLLGAELRDGGLSTRRVARRRALLTTDGPPPPSPWYRARPVLAVLPARPKAVRAWLRSHDPGPVEVVLHGLEADVVAWWRQLGSPPRGPQGVRIELTRRDDDAVAVVTDARDRTAAS